MAVVQKSNQSEIGHLFNHYARNANEDRYRYLYQQNRFIKAERTYLNYNLAPITDKTQNEILKNRLVEVKCLKRKDVNVMCTWSITLPKTFPEEREQEFFKQTYNFLENRYGQENVISAYVHKDENTPHIHFAFIPVVLDKKTGEEKVSAYELLTRKELKNFHPELEQHLYNYFGFKVGILNNVIKEENQVTIQQKQQSIVNEIEERQQEVNNLILKAQNQKEEINILEKKLNALNQKIKLSAEILKQCEDVDLIGKKSLISNKVVLSTDKITKLKNMAKDFIILRSRIEPIIVENKQLKKNKENIINLQIELNQVKKENELLRAKLNSSSKLL